MIDERACAVAAGGDDMSPSIMRGEALKIERVVPSEIAVGDVIVFKRHVLIGHRVLGKVRFMGRHYFMVRGDRCPYIDSPVSDRMLVGRVPGKRIPLTASLRHIFVFTVMLCWYVPASRFSKTKAFRRVNLLARRVASYGLPKVA